MQSLKSLNLPVKYFMFINPFMLLISFDIPLNTSENQRFSDVFRGYQKRSVLKIKDQC